MITYTNIKRYESLPSRDYFSLQGFSHSFCKYERNGVVEKKEVTDKMVIGSITDALLTSGRVNLSDPRYPIARQFAIAIKNQFGDMIARFKPQVSYTATMQYSGLSMITQGRADWELTKHAIIDLKLTECTTAAQFAKLMQYMGYENQVWHYGKMAQVDQGYVFPFSTKLNKMLPIVSLNLTPNYNEFWANAILKHGRAQ